MHSKMKTKTQNLACRPTGTVFNRFQETLVRIFFIMLIVGVFLVVDSNGEEKCKPVDEAKLAQIVKQAPPVPVDLEMGLKWHLIDFIDCTDPADPHDFRDQGTSQVVTGPAGKYRVSAPHQHAFFAYAFRTAGKDQPVVLVIEYPDDAKRNITFLSHDSMRPGGISSSFSFENGVYTGEPLPLSNKMQYFTSFLWPQDQWSPMTVMSFHNTGASAAASRIWVYAVDEMPPLEVTTPDPTHQRVLDAFFPLKFLATRDQFGWSSPQSAEHIVDYFRYIGVNRVTMEIYVNNTWGAMATIPSWDANDKGVLDRMLGVFDKRGGVDFIAGIMAPGFGPFTSGGKNVVLLSNEDFRKVMIKGLDEFIEHYGKYKCLKGIALGSLEYNVLYDLLRDKGALADVVEHIKKRRPDWTVFTYLGEMKREYFAGNTVTPILKPEDEYLSNTRKVAAPSAGNVIQRWEKSGKPWGDFLGDEVGALWKAWKRVPGEMKSAGLDIYEYYASEDSHVNPVRLNQPRSLIYYDVDRSSVRSKNVDSPYAAIFDQFMEGWIGLSPENNFWYRKDWVAPSTSPGGCFALANLACVMGHGDRLGITQGGWNCKYFGYESSLRKFAKAFRSLPPVVMSVCGPAPGASDGQIHDLDTMKVYSAEYQGRRYALAQNLIPYATSVTVDGKNHDLKPFEMVSWSDSISQGAPVVAIKDSAEYRALLKDRFSDFTKLYNELQTIQKEAAPEIYLQTVQKAMATLDSGYPIAAERVLGLGLPNELRLRKDILQRPVLHAPRIMAPPMKGDLDAWPKEASDLKADKGDFIAGQSWSPNSWSGPEDLSARLRLGNDGKNLYIGLEVRDNVLEKKDKVKFSFSKKDYMDWQKDHVPYEMHWEVNAPVDQEESTGTLGKCFRYTCRRTKTGFVIEGGADLAVLEVQSGGSIGMNVQVADGDETHNLSRVVPLKQVLAIPNKQNFAFWGDARNCGRLLLETGK